MKKIIIIINITILILTCINSSEATNLKIDYTETLETFNNPERGFYTPVYIKYNETGNKLISENEAKKNLIHLRLDIGSFSKAVNGKADIELTQNMLDSFEQTLKLIKSNGGTAIIRFAYTFEGVKNKEPSMEMLLTHIKQISHIITRNQEVIAYVELGFFGPWGEMHSSEICTQENVSKALDTMLENTPQNIKIGVRQPQYYTYWAGIDRNKINENITTSEMESYRVGLYNDGYLGSESDLGTFKNRELEIQWLEKQAIHTLYGGEVVANYAQGTPLNTVKYMSEEAFRTHTSYLNGIYNDKVIASWKNEIYDGTDELYKGQTGYTYVANHLGYRFVIRKANISEKIKQNEKINIELNVENVGFGNLVNNKIVTFVLVKGDKIYEIKTNLDATKWNSKEITKIVCSVDLPEGIETGDWELYVRISQYGDLKNDNNYLCVRFANNGDIWNQSIGANYLGNVSIQKQEDIIDNKVNNDVCNEISNDVVGNITNDVINGGLNNVVNSGTNGVQNIVSDDRSDLNENNVESVLENKIDNSISKKIYPKTGKNSFIVFGIVIVLLVDLWLFFIKKA